MKKRFIYVLLALFVCAGSTLPALASTITYEWQFPNTVYQFMSFTNVLEGDVNEFSSEDGQVIIVYANAPVTATMIDNGMERYLADYGDNLRGYSGIKLYAASHPYTINPETVLDEDSWSWASTDAWEEVPVATGEKVTQVVKGDAYYGEGDREIEIYTNGTTFRLEEGIYRIYGGAAWNHAYFIVVKGEGAPSNPTSTPILHTTVNLTEDGSITASLTDVWEHYREGNDGIQVYMTDGGTVTFNRDLHLVDWSGAGGPQVLRTLSAGTSYSIHDIQDPLIVRKMDDGDPWFALPSLNGGVIEGSYLRFIIAGNDILSDGSISNDNSYGDFIGKFSQSTSAPDDAPSGWAAPEVNAAIAAGLVPATLQRNYRSDVSRGAVAQMFINLIETASGATIDEFMEDAGVSIAGNPFTDTTDRAVLAANALGIINGVGEGRFDPNGTLTRAQIAAIVNRIARVMGVDTEGYTHSFADAANHWSGAELGWPSHAGIITGYEDGTFRPNGNLTTEQAIAITYRALVALST